jgi:arsenate reductase
MGLVAILVDFQLLISRATTNKTETSRENWEMQIFHNPRCSKSRQTLQLIAEAAQEVEVIEYLQNPPTVEQLRGVVSLLGITACELVREGEVAFRDLDVDLSTLSDDAVIELIVANPILMQRPIVVGNGTAIIGRPPENVLQLWT